MLAALLFVWYQVQKLQKFENENRAGFVKNSMKTAFNMYNGQYNVMVFNTGRNFEDKFRGVIKEYEVIYDGWIGNVPYWVWIFEEGEFTNKGDGGYINWSFIGSFEKNDKHVIFTKNPKKLDNYSKPDER